MREEEEVAPGLLVLGEETALTKSREIIKGGETVQRVPSSGTVVKSERGKEIQHTATGNW